MRQLDQRTPARGSLRIGRATVALAVAAGVGLVVSLLRGAPLVSILFVGLLLLLPLLTWVPFRTRERERDRDEPEVDR
jgi:Flp pilus assembly protein TadB